jgi:hypothetical protein
MKRLGKKTSKDKGVARISGSAFTVQEVLPGVIKTIVKVCE